MVPLWLSLLLRAWWHACPPLRVSWLSTHPRTSRCATIASTPWVLPWGPGYRTKCVACVETSMATPLMTTSPPGGNQLSALSSSLRAGRPMECKTGTWTVYGCTVQYVCFMGCAGGQREMLSPMTENNFGPTPNIDYNIKTFSGAPVSSRPLELSSPWWHPLVVTVLIYEYLTKKCCMCNSSQLCKISWSSSVLMLVKCLNSVRQMVYRKYWDLENQTQIHGCL